VGIIAKRESETEYLRIFGKMVQTLQPVGRLEDILVEKLTMLVWRYRRLLQAEAAEVEIQSQHCEQKCLQEKLQAVDRAKEDQGLIHWAVRYHNELVLEGAIASLKELCRQTSAKGLNRERDRQAFREVNGPLGEPGEKEQMTLVPFRRMDDKEAYRVGLLPSRYRELASTGRDPAA
jgi:hypothetical protein